MWRVVVARPEENSTLLSSELTTSALAPPPPPGVLAPPAGPPPAPHHHHHQHHWPPPPPHHHHPHHPHHHYPQHLQQHPYSHEHTAATADSQTGQENQQQQQQQQQQQSRSLKRPMSDSDCDDVFSEESGKEPCNSPGGDSCQHTSRKRRRGMIEKKRRDRINASLGELRRLVPAAARDPHSGKLEKAEILQLTVEHLRTLRNKGAEGYDSTKLAMDYHAVGWGECAAEVGRYLVTMEGLDERDPLRLRLLSHLQSFHREQPQQQQSQQQQQQQQQSQHQQQQQQTNYEQATSSSLQIQATPPPPPPPAPHPSPLAWPSAQYPTAGQYPAQYAQQQHGKPYRPWGAELAY